VLKQVKDNLPFWSEKLPELPDLIYNSLKQNQRQPTKVVRPSNKKPVILAVLAGFCSLNGSLFFLADFKITGIILFSLTALLALRAWQKLDS
jgi:ubiquinone biosynthesis protein